MKLSISKLLPSLFLCTPIVVSAQQAASQQTPTPVALVELFTSEGCSSCPPADELLRQINLKQNPAGLLIVGLSEHVTYWNNLGWQDPYSQEIFTDRQSKYAQRFSLDGPYTPQMVLNGRTQFVGSDQRALQKALQAEEGRKHLQVALLSAVRQGDGVDLHFSIQPGGREQVEVYAALTDDLDRSNVLRGENSGRSLQHAAVVRSLTRIEVHHDGRENVVHVSFPGTFDREGSPGHHVVLFVQEPNQGTILGASALKL